MAEPAKVLPDNKCSPAKRRLLQPSDAASAAPGLAAPAPAQYTRLQMDGTAFLCRCCPRHSIPVAFLDPQYRGVLDKLAYGNEGADARTGAQRISDADGRKRLSPSLCAGIDRALISFWASLSCGWTSSISAKDFTGMARLIRALEVVDYGRLGQRTAWAWAIARGGRASIASSCKSSRAAPKAFGQLHNIPDVWRDEECRKSEGASRIASRVALQAELIRAVSNQGDGRVIDPAAGSFSVMEAARARARQFIGCDLEG